MPRKANKPSARGTTYITVVDCIDHNPDTLSTGRPTYHGCTIANVDDVLGTLHGDQCIQYRGTTAEVVGYRMTRHGRMGYAAAMRLYR